MSDGLRLLSSLLANSGLHVLRDIGEELFVDGEKAVYQYIVSHHRRYAGLPRVSTLEADLQITLPEPREPVAFYVDKLHKRRIYNTMREHLPPLKEAINKYDTENIIKITDMVSVVSRRQRTNSDVRHLGEALTSVLTGYENARVSPGLTGVVTGWPQLDEETSGYQPGDLIAMVARMGLGKTFLLIYKAYSAWVKGHNVLFVTMEMSIEQITRRLSGFLSGVNPIYIRKAMLSRWAESRLRNAIDTLAGTERFRIYSGSFAKSMSDLDTLVSEFNPDIIYIDGAYLLKPDGMGSKHINMVERVPEIYHQLKRISLARNLPIITTTQYNRGAGKDGKAGSLENIGFTDAIGRDCSVVLSVERGDVPNSTSQRRIKTLKGREGEEAEFSVNYSFAPMNFSQVEQEGHDANAQNDLDMVFE